MCASHVRIFRNLAALSFDLYELMLLHMCAEKRSTGMHLYDIRKSTFLCKEKQNKNFNLKY